MISQWFEFKDRAVSLRKEGLSIREIEKLLFIPRSTLSNWLRTVELKEEHKTHLKRNADLALVKARVKASEWHRTQKALRIQNAKMAAEHTLSNIKIDDNIAELALAMLYLGEGAKKNTTAIGNSNPMILKFFLTMLRKKYRVREDQIKCELHLRADQNPQEIKEYWSKILELPLLNFRTVVFDKRTIGRATYSSYKGVCIINCGNIAIQRKLINLYNLFCQQVIEEWAVSSVG